MGGGMGGAKQFGVVCCYVILFIGGGIIIGIIFGMFIGIIFVDFMFGLW